MMIFLGHCCTPTVQQRGRHHCTLAPCDWMGWGVNIYGVQRHGTHDWLLEDVLKEQAKLRPAGRVGRTA